MKGSIKRGDVVVYKNDALRTPMIVAEEPDEHGRTAHVWFPRRDWSNPSFGYCDSSAVELMEPVSTRVDTEFETLVSQLGAREIPFGVRSLAYSISTTPLSAIAVETHLRVDVSGTKRGTTKPFILTLSRRLETKDRAELYEAAFDLFKTILVHELQEHLVVEGLWRDPHDPEGPVDPLHDARTIRDAWTRAASSDDKNRAQALAEWAHLYGLRLLDLAGNG